MKQLWINLVDDDCGDYIIDLNDLRCKSEWYHPVQGWDFSLYSNKENILRLGYDSDWVLAWEWED